MTGIAFHVNLADRLAYACRLLRKAAASGSRVLVTGPQADLRALTRPCGRSHPRTSCPTAWPRR